MSVVLSNLIGGEAVPPDNDEWFDDIAPATGDVIARIPRSGPSDVDHAVLAALGAMDGSWGSASTAERAELCDDIAAAIEVRLDEFAELESRDTGKPISFARNVDIPRSIANFRFYAGAVRHDETGFHPMADAINYTVRQPLGAVALITPWNLPLYLLSWKAAAALATGNAIVAKPSELTPCTADALADVIANLGAPAGAFNVVHGYGAEVGQALVEHPDIKAVSFTGGTVTGRRVAATAAPQLKKLSLELGGKNPTIVFADADIDLAVEGAVRAGFSNTGQICLCGSRILVERSIFAEFTDRLVEQVGQMVVGAPDDPNTQVGSLIGPDHRSKVEAYIELARQDGGTIRCGGKRPDLPAPWDGGAFLEPTVITGLDPGCRTATEEIFGPVVTVHPFDSEEEAVGLANAVEYGLAASVWTEDLRRAHRVAATVQAGMVWVNTWLHRDLRVPFGGMKNSGVGREGGRWSLDFFTDQRNICIKL